MHFILASAFSFLALRPLELLSHAVISRSGVRPEKCRAWAERGVGEKITQKAVERARKRLVVGLEWEGAGNHFPSISAQVA